MNDDYERLQLQTKKKYVLDVILRRALAKLASTPSISAGMSQKMTTTC